jgi:hypothetical protein
VTAIAIAAASAIAAAAVVMSVLRGMQLDVNLIIVPYFGQQFERKPR